MDIKTLKVSKAAPVQRVHKKKRDLGPNPWLDKTWDFGLQASYDNREAYAAEFPGKVEKLPVKYGERKGELVDKVTGEAANAITQIREAGRILGLGVAIRTAPARNGFIKVTWYGQKKKSYNTKDDKPVKKPAETTPPSE